MSVTVTVTKKQGSTMGTVIVRIGDQQNVVRDVYFYIAVPGRSGELGPYPPDVVRRPSPGVYEKDVVLDPEFETLVRIEVITETQGPVTFTGDVQTFGARTATAGGTGEVRVKAANTAPTVADTLAIKGAVVNVASRVATFNLDDRYSPLSHAHAFTSLTSRPTTLAGYGITDAYTSATSDARYHPLNGAVADTQLSANIARLNGSASFAGIVSTSGAGACFYAQDRGGTFGWVMYASTGSLRWWNGVSDRMLLDPAGALTISGSIASGTGTLAGTGTSALVLNASAASFYLGGAALQARVGSLLVSNSYADAPSVPANGIWAKGSVQGSSVSAIAGELSTGGVSGGLRTHDRTGGWSYLQYVSGGTLRWYSAQSSADTMTLTQGGLLNVATATATQLGANRDHSGTSGGLALYGMVVDTYGIAMRTTAWGGTHGSVNGDWATYFNMDGTTPGRGWVFRASGVGNVASVSNTGNATFNGGVTAAWLYPTGSGGMHSAHGSKYLYSSMDGGYWGVAGSPNPGFHFRSGHEGTSWGYVIGTASGPAMYGPAGSLQALLVTNAGVVINGNTVFGGNGTRDSTRSWIGHTPNLHLDSSNASNIYLSHFSNRSVNIGGADQNTFKLAVMGDAILSGGGWFRNSTTGHGLYNQETGNHLYAAWDGHHYVWNITGVGGNAAALCLRTGYGSGLASAQGWLFGGGGSLGLRDSARNWRVRVDTNGVQLYGSTYADSLHLNGNDPNYRLYVGGSVKVAGNLDLGGNMFDPYGRPLASYQISGGTPEQNGNPPARHGTLWLVVE